MTMTIETLHSIHEKALLTGIAATLVTAGAFTGHDRAHRDNNPVPVSSESWMDSPYYQLQQGKDADPAKLPAEFQPHRDTIMGVDVEDATWGVFKVGVGAMVLMAVGAVGTEIAARRQERKSIAVAQSPNLQTAPPLYP